MPLLVKYSCSLCDLVDIEVKVPFRLLSQDVVDWMEKTCAPRLAHDHAARSPNCHPNKLQGIKIPVEDDEGNKAAFVGGPMESKE